MRQNYRGKYNPGNRPDNDLLTVRMDSEELERTFDSLEEEEKERILEYREEMLQDVKKYLGSDLVKTIGVKEYFHNYLKTPLSRKVADEDVNKMIKPTAMTLLAKKEHAIAIMRDAVDKLMKDRDSNGEYYDGRSGVFLGLQIDNNQRLTNHFVVIREKLFFGEQHEFHAALAPFNINKDYQGKSDFLDSKENFQRYQMPYNCHFYPVAGTVDVCIDTKQDAKPTKVHLLYSFSGTDVLYDYLFGDGDKNIGMITLKKLVDTEGNESKFPSKFFTKMKSFVQKYFTETYEQYIKTGRRIYGEKSVLETRYIDILPECYIDAMELSREMDRLCNIPIGTLPDSEKKKYIALDVLRNAINEKNTKGRKYELERMEHYITKTSELGHLDPSVIITPELKKEELHECMLNFKQKVTFTKEFTEERIYKINAPDTKPQKLVVLSSPEITKVKDNNAVMSFEAFDMISMQKIVCNLFVENNIANNKEKLFNIIRSVGTGGTIEGQFDIMQIASVNGIPDVLFSNGEATFSMVESEYDFIKSGRYIIDCDSLDPQIHRERERLEDHENAIRRDEESRGVFKYRKIPGFQKFSGETDNHTIVPVVEFGFY